MQLRREATRRARWAELPVPTEPDDAREVEAEIDCDHHKEKATMEWRNVDDATENVEIGVVAARTWTAAQHCRKPKHREAPSVAVGQQEHLWATAFVVER